MEADISSVKYSTKYKEWIPSTSSANYLPDYVRAVIWRNSSSNNMNSAKITPVDGTGNGYKVKNIRQHNIVFRVFIHYIKKLHPKRLVVSSSNVAVVW